MSSKRKYYAGNTKPFEESYMNKEWIKPIIEHNIPTKWNWMVSYPEGLKLGTNVDIGAFSYIMAKHGVIIGDYVQMGSHCSIYSENSEDLKQGEVKIGNSVKIGSHSTIMPGVTIGNRAVIGAYSFVKKSIPADCLAYGIPCKKISRF